MSKILISPMLTKVVENNNLNHNEIDIDIDALASSDNGSFEKEKEEEQFSNNYVPPMSFESEQEEQEEKKIPDFDKEELEKKAKINANFLTSLVFNIIPTSIHYATRINETEILEQIQKNELPETVLEKVVRFNKSSYEKLQMPAWAKEALDTSLVELAKQKGKEVIASPTTMITLTLLAIFVIVGFAAYGIINEGKLIKQEIKGLSEKLKEKNKKEEQ